MKRRARHFLLTLALTALAGTAPAQGLVGPSPATWSALNPAQQAVLAPLQRDWASITPAQQQKWLEVANRYGGLPPDERARVQQRMSEWSRMSTTDRARARLNFTEARQISPEDRQRQWEAYRALPADQRRALAEKAQAKPSPKPVARRDQAPVPEKSSVVRAPASPQPRTVGPTVVQRGPGASTNLVSTPSKPPLHQQAGLPKVAATPEFVDAATLLPQRGAQGAGATRPATPNSGSKGSKASQDR